MYCLALANDYDGTLAGGGVVHASTVDALERFKKTGRYLILVTGRELPDVKAAFPEIAIFDRVIAKNGAVVYNPATEEQCLLGEPPPKAFLARLRDRKVTPLSVGES